MTSLLAFIHKHPFEIAVAYWLFAAVVHRMPAPRDQDGSFYRWLFNLCQLIPANFGKLAEGLPAQLLPLLSVLTPKPDAASQPRP